MLRVIRPLAATALAVAALTSCSDDSSDGGSAAPASTAETTTITEASAATTEPTPETDSTGTTTRAAGAGVVEEALTPVVGQVTNAPAPVLGTDGRTYLAYELLLINATTTPVVLDSVKALDGTSGDELQEHTGDDLVGHARVIGAVPDEGGPTQVRLMGGQAALVWLDPSMAEGTETPSALVHELAMTFDEAPNPPAAGRGHRDHRPRHRQRRAGPGDLTAARG